MKYSTGRRWGKWKTFFPLPLLSLLILVGALSDSFGKPSPIVLPSSETLGGEIAERKTRIVIGSITLEEPRIVLRLGKGKKSELVEVLPHRRYKMKCVDCECTYILTASADEEKKCQKSCRGGSS